MEQFVVSARKYRPATFETVVGQNMIATTLKNAIQRQHLAHAYLFCGPRGVGKTTCARIFAKTINCLQPSAELEACGTCESCRSFSEGRSYSIHELDAASNNSVEDIRTLTEQVRVPPQIGKYSVYIIDEVHMLSASAFNAFLKTLEEPPAHAIFILATTEKHKILPTILSRCQIYDFNRISIDGMEKYLKNIAQKEQINIEDAALNVIAQKADGAMRDALSLFDQVVAFCGNNITYDTIIKNLHVVDYKYYFMFTDCFLAHQHTEALLLFDEVLAKGFDALHFIAGLSEHFRNLLVCKDPATLKLFESSETFKQDYVQQTANCSIDFLFEALNITNACEMSYKSSGNPRLHVELVLLRLAAVEVEKKNSEPEITLPPSSPTTDKTPAAPPKEIVPANEPKPMTVEPERKATPPPPTISLKKEFNEKEQKTMVAMAQQANKETSFTQNDLLQTWAKLTEEIKNARLANALQAANPTLKENHTITCFVDNSVQKEWIEQKMASQIVGFLKTHLQNDLLTLEVAIAPQDAAIGVAQLYTPEQKFKYLQENYSGVEKLKHSLGLYI